MRRSRIIAVVTFGLLLAWHSVNATAQIPGADAFLNPPGQTNRDEATETPGATAKRNENAVRLASSVKELKRQQDTENQESKPSPGLEREVDLRKQIDAVLAQQQSADVSKTQLSTQADQLKKELDALRINGLAVEPPYSFIKFDQLNNELESAEGKLTTINSTLVVANDALAAARKAKEIKDPAVRLAKEAVEINRDDAKRGQLDAALKIAELEAKLADETLTLRRATADNNQLVLQISTLSVDLLKEQIRLMQSGVRFSDADLQEVQVEIDKKEHEGKQAIPSAELKLKAAERSLNLISTKVDEKPGDPVLAEELTAGRLEFRLRRDELDFENARLARLSRKREMWIRRHKVNNEKATNAELTQWAEEAHIDLATVERDRLVQAAIADELRKDLVALDARLQTTDDASEIEKWLKEQQESLQQLLLVKDRNLAGIDSLAQVEHDLLTDIEGDFESWTVAERFEGVWAFVVGLWNTELLVIDELPITVGKVITGMIFLIIGFFVARILSRLLSNRLLQRFGMDEGAAAAIKSLSFYIFVTIFTLLSLRLANVPLTVFTLLGGALAIGVGFGSQAIINNFISGLILLAERPIQVGDLVKLDDLIGNVTHIGTRSTRIRTGDNLDIIVPNSKFLENNVLNYTLSDDRFRTNVSVGLAYGSPTREASRLLIKAAEEHGLILKNPKPFVWFRDFGSDSLVFELHIWMKVRTLGERLRIESDMRFRIDQLFREAGIVIAYPQRDVHLDCSKPLDIRMMTPGETGHSFGRENAA